MIPTPNSKLLKYGLIALLGLIITSCNMQPERIIDDKNIRVIQLDPGPLNATDYVLNANREELTRYDCDLNWILFGYNSDELSRTAKLELEKAALIILENDNFKARIRAFTDSKGRKEYNEKLSARRALSAKNYLISEGIDAKNISIDGYADAKPIALNTEDDTGRQFNRRIELFVLDKLNNTVCRSHPPEIPKSLKVDAQ